MEMNEIMFWESQAFKYFSEKEGGTPLQVKFLISLTFHFLSSLGLFYVASNEICNNCSANLILLFCKNSFFNFISKN